MSGLSQGCVAGVEAEPHPRASPETTSELQSPSFFLECLAPSRCTMELALPAIVFTLFPGALLGSENLTTNSYSLSPLTDRRSINLDSGKVRGGEQGL